MNISQLDIDAAIEELLAQTPKAEYPEDHKAAMRVPKGGSSCASCEYLADNKTDCKNEYFQKWNGSAVIPAPIDEYCSDWYEETKDEPSMIEAGGPGSGCNPEVGKCGRPAGEGEESDADTEREKGLSELQAISDWQAGSHLIRAAAKDILSGQKSDVAYDADAAKDAAILLDEIRNAPVYKGAIYRGLVAYKDNPVLNLKPGDEFQLPLDSFSANLGVAHGFSYGTIPNEQETHVVFQVDDAKGFDLSRAAGDAVYKEVEIVTNGRFKVDKVEDVKSFGPDKFHMVHLQQLGVL